MFCKQCGSQLKDGAAFCTNCGAKQNPAQTQVMPKAEEDLEKTVGIAKTVPNFAKNTVAEKPVAPVQKPPQPVVHQSFQPVQQTPVQPQNAYNPSAGNSHNGKVSFSQAISLFFKNYVNFSGRASKSEFWWVILFNVITFIPLSLISAAIPPLGGLCSIALMIPGISLTVRRLHDIGKSGGYCFLSLIPFVGSIILLVMLLGDSNGDNQYGPGPNSAAGTVVNAAVDNSYAGQKVVTDHDVFLMAQKREPINVNTPEAKQMMDAALGRIIPTYTGIENLAGAMMLCDPQNIKANIAAMDTDTLFVIFKALGFYMGRGVDPSILGIAQQNVLATLKNRL